MKVPDVRTSQSLNPPTCPQAEKRKNNDPKPFCSMTLFRSSVILLPLYTFAHQLLLSCLQQHLFL